MARKEGKGRILGVKIMSSESPNDYEETTIDFAPGKKKQVPVSTPMPNHNRDVTIDSLQSMGFEYDTTIILGKRYFHLTTSPLSFTCFVLCNSAPTCNYFKAGSIEPFLTCEKIDEIRIISGMKSYGTIVFRGSNCCLLLEHMEPEYYSVPSDIINTPGIMFYPVIRMGELMSYQKETIESAAKHSCSFSWNNNKIPSMMYDESSEKIIELCKMIIDFSEYRPGIFQDLQHKRSNLIDLYCDSTCRETDTVKCRLRDINTLINLFTISQTKIVSAFCPIIDELPPILAETECQMGNEYLHDS